LQLLEKEKSKNQYLSYHCHAVDIFNIFHSATLL
jgi:hypothetical protein